MAEELTPRRGTPPGGRNKRKAGGRQHVIKVLVSDDELEQIEARAIALSISRQRVLIEAATGVPPLTRRQREVLHQELTRIKYLLANLTNNVNQIAKALNSDAEVPAPRIAAALERTAAAAQRVEELAEEYRA